MTLTLLSPTWAELRRLRPVWERECRKAGLLPGSREDALAALEKDRKLRPRRLGRERLDIEQLARAPFEPDRAPANGSSIAVLAEYEEKSCLLAADAFPTVLTASIRRLLAERGQRHLRLDAVKVSHHGSRFNTSPDLLTTLRCSRFLVSTTGVLFGHPDAEAMARILAARNPSTRLCFNYRTEQTEAWAESIRHGSHRGRVELPRKGTEGWTVDL
jgi:hypothetical protein